MATVNFQVLEGFEAGHLFCDLETPVTIAVKKTTTSG